MGKIKSQLKIFDTQAFGIMDTIFEWCPNCGKEVEVPAIMGKYKCSNCGKEILTCSLCYDEHTKCSECRYEGNNNDKDSK